MNLSDMIQICYLSNKAHDEKEAIYNVYTNKIIYMKMIFSYILSNTDVTLQ
jgi:hypothetical protein